MMDRCFVWIFASSVLLASGFLQPGGAEASFRIALNNGETLQAEEYRLEDGKISLKFKTGTASFPVGLVRAVTDEAGRGVAFTEPGRHQAGLPPNPSPLGLPFEVKRPAPPPREQALPEDEDGLLPGEAEGEEGLEGLEGEYIPEGEAPETEYETQYAPGPEEGPPLPGDPIEP